MKMPTLSKEQQQVAMLGVIMAIIAGVGLWYFRASILPQPDGLAGMPVIGAGEYVPSVDQQEVYARKDFKALRRFGDLPVRPRGAGNPDPFIPDDVTAQ